jgi:hypothetical protein
VKLLSVQNDRLIFRLDNAEQQQLALLLSLYPVLPPAHQPLSKSLTDADRENQLLLDEALAEQRSENKKLVREFLSSKKTLRPLKTSWRLILTSGQIEWLLQVLNDVRVGSWVRLGSPDEWMGLNLNAQNVAHAWAMELAGAFQMDFLQAMNSAPVNNRNRTKPN